MVFSYCGPMTAARSYQLNIRSRFARERATQIAARTGQTVTQVVEEALRSYQPIVKEAPEGLVWERGILVKPASGRRITLEEANAALDEVRSELGG